MLTVTSETGSCTLIDDGGALSTSPDGWCAHEEDLAPYLEVDFLSERNIIGLVLHPRLDADERVRDFTLECRTLARTWDVLYK